MITRRLRSFFIGIALIVLYFVAMAVIALFNGGAGS
jgi:hypothetical protein